MREAIVVCGIFVFALAAGAEAEERVEIPVTLAPGAPDTKLQPRFGAKAVDVKLRSLGDGTSGRHDPVAGTLRLGPEPGDGRPFVMTRTGPDRPHDLLVIDADGDGELDHDAPVLGGVSGAQQQDWRTFKVTLQVRREDGGTEPYAISLWPVVASKGALPKAARFTRFGYRTGQVRIEEELFDVVLSDADNDAVFDEGDHWTLRRALDETMYRRNAAREVGDFAWAKGGAWRLELDGTAGRSGRLVPVDPGISQEDDEKKRDPFWEDRQAERAELPLELHGDPEVAAQTAKQELAPLFLWFVSYREPVLHDPQVVFDQKRVVSAATGLVSARVDVDAHPKLAETHEVKKTPTGVIFDPSGEELARFTGMTSGDDFLAFLAEAHSYLHPADHEPEKLGGSAKKRHKKEVKEIYKYLDDNKGHGLLVDRIADVGTRKNRAARDALIRFAEKRKSKEYIAAAFKALAVIKGRVAIDFLCGEDALGSGDFLVAQQAAEALAIAKDPLSIEPIIDVMTDRRTKIEIVHACAIALAKAGPEHPRVHSIILEYSDHQKDTIRAGAVEALGYLKSEEAHQRLQHLLVEDKNTRVRGAAALGLGHTKRTEFIPILRAAIEADNAHTVRTNGLEAIRELQGEERK